MSAPAALSSAAPVEVAAAHAALRAWLFDHALPFWAQAGRDGPGLGFHEHLTLDGRPAEVPFKRVRVQARQVHVFSHAALLGWQGGLDAARHGYAFMVAHGSREDGAWVRAMGRHGGVLDPAADLYDLAFVLFALAWYARASGEAEPLARARRTLDWVRATMAAPAGGFHNAWPVEPGARQQNPHMHLLEAALALYETTGDAHYADFARELAALFRDRFLDPATGTLGEFFTDDLRPAAGEAGDHVEPGHHYEWVWLLDQHARLTGEDTSAEAERLYRFAEAHGVDRATGAVLDVVGRDGLVRRASSRLWPQTEAIKAHAAMLRRGEPAGPRIRACADTLLRRHFSDCPPGTWREHFDAEGRAFLDRIPSSSFYHIVMAFGELDRLVTERHVVAG